MPSCFPSPGQAASWCHEMACPDMYLERIIHMSMLLLLFSTNPLPFISDKKVPNTVLFIYSIMYTNRLQDFLCNYNKIYDTIKSENSRRDYEMKKLSKQIFTAWCLGLFFICMTLTAKTEVQASTLGDSIYLNKNNTTLYYDMNGNGKKDAVRISCTKLNDYYYKSFQVYINGKSALKKSIVGCSGLNIRYMSSSPQKNYLQIVASQDGGYMYTNKIYIYSGGKLIEAADLGKVDNMLATVTKVTSNSITVKFSVQPYETGRIEWNFVYQPNGNKLKLKSNTASAISTLGSWMVNDGYQKYFKKNQFVTARKRTYYTPYNLKTKAFTTKAGDILTLRRVKVINKKLYINFVINGKNGWTRVTGKPDSGGEWFRGVSKRLAG